MSYTLENVVPWGRNLDEYVAMFALTQSDLAKKILGCGDGPASFNAEWTAQGGTVVSVDPIYRSTVREIRGRIDAVYDEVIDQTRQNRDQFVWRYVKSVEALSRIRMAAMERFMADYRSGDGRYVNAELPTLPFGDNTFDLALCSHLLFLYSEQLSAEFHIQSVQALCRVAAEVRIFPLLGLDGKRSGHLEKVMHFVVASGCACAIEKVSYEFQKGGNEMLRITSPQ